VYFIGVLSHGRVCHRRLISIVAITGIIVCEALSLFPKFGKRPFFH
jgi:hypothetical protein